MVNEMLKISEQLEGNENIYSPPYTETFQNFNTRILTFFANFIFFSNSILFFFLHHLLLFIFTSKSPQNDISV